MHNGLIQVVDSHDGWEVGVTTFWLPDGQRVKVLMRLERGEHQIPRWVFLAWENPDTADRLVASFQIPLDRSKYPV